MQPVHRDGVIPIKIRQHAQLLMVMFELRYSFYILYVTHTFAFVPSTFDIKEQKYSSTKFSNIVLSQDICAYTFSCFKKDFQCILF